MTSKSMTFRLPAPLAQAIEARARATGRDRTTVVTEALAQVFELPLLSPAPATLEMLQQQIEQTEAAMGAIAEQVLNLEENTQAAHDALLRLDRLEALVGSLQSIVRTVSTQRQVALTASANVQPCLSLPESNGSGGEAETLQMIARLEQQAATHELILATIPDPIFVYDRLSRFTYVNPAGARVLGVEQQHLIGKTLQDFDLPAELKQHLANQFERVLATAQPIRDEIRIPTATLGVRDYERIVSPVPGPTGSLDAVVCIARDITERKQAEMALRQSEANYRDLFESANESIFVFDVATRRILNANARAARRLGYTRQELLQLTIDDVDVPLLPETQAMLSRELRSRGNLIFEHAHRHKDGTRIPVELSSRMIEYGDRLAVQSFVRDITERKQTEQALRKSEERFRRIFEDAPIGIMLVNCDTREIVQANLAMCRLLGYTEAELKNLLVEQIAHQDEQEPTRQCLSRMQQQVNGSFQAEKRFITKARETIWVSLTATTFYEPDYQATFSLKMIEDITERKQAEERLRLLESAIAHATDAILITEATPIDEPGPRIVYANTTFSAMTGYTAEEVIGKSPRLLHGEKTDRQQLDRIRAAMTQHQSVTVELINYSKQGDEFYVEMTIMPVLDKTGACTHFMAVQRLVGDRS